MDPHPTPFPGKLRTTANAKKEKGDGKSSREASRMTTMASRHRQNRVFGTVRSTNVTVDQKPPQGPTKVFRQLRPPGTSKKLPNSSKDGPKMELKKEPTGASREDAKDVIRKDKPVAKRSSVRFLDQQGPLEKGCSSEGVPEEGPRTPLSSIIKPTVLLGTPYHSAQTCSKCRFDRLESAPYWLTQIKLAESVGKHLVSAAFFRLALECNAEPIRNMKSELKRYVARHSSLHVLAVWKEVCRDYGLLNGEPSLGVIEFDPVAAFLGEKKDPPRSVMQQGVSGDDKDERLGCESGGVLRSNLSKEGSSKNAGSGFVELDSNIGENHPSAAVIGDGTDDGVSKPTVNVSEDNDLTKDKTDDRNAAFHCVDKDSSVVITPGKNFLPEKSEGDSSASPNGSSQPHKHVDGGRCSSLSPNGSSSVRKEVQPHNHVDGGRCISLSPNGSSVRKEVQPHNHVDGGRGSSLSPNDSSSMRKKVQPHNHADGGGTTSGKSQAASGSWGKGSGKGKDEAKKNEKSKEGAKRNQNSGLKSAGSLDENSIKIKSEKRSAAALGSSDDNQGSG